MRKKILNGMVIVICALALFLTSCDSADIPEEDTPHIAHNTNEGVHTYPTPPQEQETPHAPQEYEEYHEGEDARPPLSMMTDSPEIHIPDGFGDEYEWVPLVLPTAVYIGMEDGTPVTIILQGRELQFDDSGPVMLGGEVFVPVYGVFEYMEFFGVTNFAVGWDEVVSTRDLGSVVNIVTIANSDRIITVTEGELVVSAEGVSPLVPDWYVLASQPAQWINGNFMIPLRPIAEAMSVVVEWHQETGNVHMFMSRLSVISYDADGEQVGVRVANPYV